MITRREQEMLDLHEAGFRDAQIAERMGVKVGTVRRTLSMLSVGTDSDARFAARLGSEMLLAAIGRHHPEQLAARPGRPA